MHKFFFWLHTREDVMQKGFYPNKHASRPTCRLEGKEKSKKWLRVVEIEVQTSIVWEDAGTFAV